MFHPLLNIIEFRTTHNPNRIVAHYHVHHHHFYAHSHYRAQKQYPFGEGPHAHAHVQAGVHNATCCWILRL